MLDYGLDGLDLDWEYPAIKGYPGHEFRAEDRENFTALVAAIRNEFEDDYELSFAAGAGRKFLDNSVEWQRVMPLVDRVNLMTYDLVSGDSPTTGHHTPLYSTAAQAASAESAVDYLLERGVEPQKIVIGAAFYARVWQHVTVADGSPLYRPGEFVDFVGYNKLEDYLDDGYLRRWDETAQAPYAYNADSRRFATYDDPRSVALKTEFVLDRKLGGIMFWQLGDDVPGQGLLDAIATTVGAGTP